MLGREASILLLQELSPRLRRAPAAAIDNLAAALGDQPLALILAGLYLEERPLFSVAAYVTAIEETAEALPDSFARWATSKAEPTAHRLAAAFLLSLRTLQGSRAAGKLAGRLLQTASCCASATDIPADLLQAALSPGNNAVFTRALESTIRLGLLQGSEQQVCIHPQIAALTRLIEEPEEAALRGLAAALLERSAGARQPEKAEEIFPLLPHLESVLNFSEKIGQQLTGQLRITLGHLYRANHQLDRARESFERGMTAYKQAYGSLMGDGEQLTAAQKVIAASCCHLAAVHSDLGDLLSAKAYFERALALQEAAYSREYPGVADTCLSLGQVLHGLGELGNAKQHFARAHSIHSQAFHYGPKHPATADDLHHLGLVLYDLDELEEARTCFEQALAINEWVYGLKHTAVTENLHQLGRVLRAQGSLEAARECFERLLLLEKRISGEDGHIDPIALNQLGLIMQDLGMTAEARACFEQALAFDQQTYGSQAPSAARDINNLGCVLRDLRDLPAARDCFQQALAISEQSPSPHQRETSIYANNLGRILYNLNDLQAAKACFERVLAADEHIYGPDHHQVASDAANLGTVLQELGEREQARICFQRAHAILEKTRPPDYPRLVDVRKSLERLNQRA